MNTALLQEILQDRLPTGPDSIEIFSLRPKARESLVPERLVSSGDRVLHVGAGAGLDSVGLAAAVGIDGRVFAVEPDFGLYRQASENIRLSGFAQIEVVNAPLEALPFADDSVTMAICNTVWTDCAAPDAMLDEVARVVRKGGRLFMREFISVGAEDPHRLLKGHLGKNAWAQPPTAAALRKILTEAGFVDIHIQLDGAHGQNDQGQGLVAVTVDAGKGS